MVTALVVVVVLTVLTALYVAAEFSAISVRRSRVRQMAEDGHFLALRLAPFVADARKLDTYIAASQIGITLTSLILGAYGQAAITPTITQWIMPWADGDAAWALSVASIATLVALTTFNVIVGELVPKTLALQHPTPVALATVMPMLWSLTLYRPFIGVLNGSGNLILRLFGVQQSGHRHVHSPEELELLIAESRDGGLLEPDEHRRLQRALRLNLRQAKQLMVPRPKISAIDINTPLNKVIDVVSQSPFSRVPVYRDSIDNIVGMLHIKDLVRWLVGDGGTGTTTLAGLIRPMASVHESVTVDRVLRQLRERRSHQALVVDEFGGTAGLLTLEDVLSELLGDVGDEFRPGEPVPEELPDGRMRLPGSLSVEDAEVLLRTSFETDATTVGGLVTAALGHLPVAGERVNVGAFELTVEQVARRAVETVLARRLSPEPGEDDE